jgi:hypothetical protein
MRTIFALVAGVVATGVLAPTVLVASLFGI